ncbi:hypothetical protein RZS08_31255, partial [Arthrospira platensis SPKY1]|nr:hypothetical protein [Arthrospira platensis SPKY1]
MTDSLDRYRQLSMGPAGAPPAAPPTLVDRVVKVFVAPSAAMREVAERPAWLFPLAIICAVVWLFTAASLHVILPEQTERQLAHAEGAQIEALEQ